MKKQRGDSYENQLTSEERSELRQKLLSSGLTLRQVSEQSPPWRSGPEVGKHVAPATLSKILTRLRSKELLGTFEQTGTLIKSFQDKLRKEPSLSGTSPETLDTICTLLAQQILDAVIKQGQADDRLSAVQVLLKRQDQLLAEARFQRDTCQKFFQWSQNKDVQRVLKSSQSNHEKIETLGKLLYRDLW